MFLKVALEEPQEDDMIRERNGVRIALKKGLDPDKSRITIDYTDAGFVATFE